MFSQLTLLILDSNKLLYKLQMAHSSTAMHINISWVSKPVFPSVRATVTVDNYLLASGSTHFKLSCENSFPKMQHFF